MEEIIARAQAYVRACFAGDSSGHDAQHSLRVWRTALQIAREESADLLVTQLAALLHDVDDRKLSPDTCEGKDNAVAFMRREGVADETIARVVAAIRTVSFSAGLAPDTLEGKIVQDADRLDAMGAIGIARTFAFGGSRGRAIYDPEEPPAQGLSPAEYVRRASASINHFYEKLLLLKNGMHTSAGRRLAQARHAYMEGFLAEFFAEWEGER